jgi:thiol-disulfide isomerase/thioredoxin
MDQQVSFLMIFPARVENRYRGFLLFILVTALVLSIPTRGEPSNHNNAAEIQQLFRQLDVTTIQGAAPLQGQVHDLQGQEVDLSTFKGNVAFLTFWTTWCPSCRIEMPALQKLYAHYQNQGFLVLAVNIEEPASKVAKYFRATGLSYTPLLDPQGRLARRMGVWSIPSTFIINRRGIVLGRVVGSRHWDSPEGRRLIQLLLTPQ